MKFSVRSLAWSVWALLLLVGLTTTAVCSAETVKANTTLPKLQTVSSVELSKYAGDWFEIALIPYYFQSQCVANAKVAYTPLAPGVFKDYFECTQKNGKKSVSVGRAKVVNTQSNATLSASFLNLLGWRYWFGENYWITDLAKDYSYTVVVHPSRNYAWILARTPALSPEVLTGIADRLNAQGVDACRLKMSPQSGGAQASVSLCEVLKPSAK